MHGFSPEQQDQLVRRLESLRRRMWISVAIVVALVVTGVVWAINTFDNPALPTTSGALIGMGIGWLLRMPERRLLDEWGLSREAAMELLRDARERRSGVVRSASERAERLQRRSRIWLASALVSTVLMVGCGIAFSSQAGQTAEEGAPLDPWFVASGFGAFGALLLVGGFFGAWWHDRGQAALARP